MKQKERNIKAELAGGVKKNYQPIGVSLIEKSINNRFKTFNQDEKDINTSQSPKTQKKINAK